jgi:tight adherence protein C
VIGAAVAAIAVVWALRAGRERALARRLLAPGAVPDRVATPGSVVAAVGRPLRRAAGRAADPAADRRAGALAVAAVVAGLLSPALAVPPLGAIAGFEWWDARRRAARAAAVLLHELPDIVDLLALAVGSGATPRLAVEAAGRYGPGALAAAFRQVVADVDQRGARLADALAELPHELGPDIGVVVRPLVAAERYGTALAPSLELVGRDLRDLRRRRTEEVIRRVPVKLVFPLVCCTLPAFALLTIVPLLAGSLRQLGLV